MSEPIQVKLTKAKGKFISVNPEDFSDETYQYIFALGLEAAINARMTKVGAVTKLTGKELENAQALAVKIATENLEDLKAGKIKHTRGKSKSTIPAAVMAEARRLAKTALKDAVRAAGLKPSHYDEKAYTAKAKEMIESNPEFLTQATANIEARKTPAFALNFDIADLGPEVAKKSRAKTSELPAGIVKPTVQTAFKGATH